MTFLGFVCCFLFGAGITALHSFISPAFVTVFNWVCARVGVLNKFVGGRVVNAVGSTTAALVMVVTLAGTVSTFAPPPREVRYDTLAINPEATWLQRNVTYAGLNSGLMGTEVQNRFVYSKGVIRGTTKNITLLGLPGGKWWAVDPVVYKWL
jgi:hypothetical protein